jgi:hypothetical protein
LSERGISSHLTWHGFAFFEYNRACLKGLDRKQGVNSVPVRSYGMQPVKLCGLYPVCFMMMMSGARDNLSRQAALDLRLIKEWSVAHRVELEANWSRGKAGEPLERIAPLD